MNNDERQLVTRLLAGSESAFNTFFDEQYPKLYRFVMMRTRDPDLAQEMAQAVLCTALEKIPTWRGEAALTSWLFTICRNRLIDLGRRSSHVADFGSGDLLDAILDSVVADETPDDVLQSENIASMVTTVLDRLPAAHAEVLRFKYAMELSMQDIAQRLETTVKAVESRLSRARASFKNMFLELADTAGEVSRS